MKALRRTMDGRVWSTAVYIRLSRDDGREESLSVANQRKVIGDFLARECPGEMRVRETYIEEQTKIGLNQKPFPVRAMV